MFSPLTDPHVANWFRRLDAAWRHMPADEQARQREEVQQHLEGLVAAKVAAGQSPEAAWYGALAQFGNPGKFGRKMAQEWRRSETRFGVDTAAISFVFVCEILLFYAYSANRFFDGHQTHHPNFLSYVLTCLGWMVPAVVGMLYPMQAIKGYLYGRCFAFCCFWTYICASSPIDLPRSMAVILPGFALGVIKFAAIAYLSSVTKRGWYKPTWEDFKIALPKRRRQVG